MTRPSNRLVRPVYSVGHQAPETAYTKRYKKLSEAMTLVSFQRISLTGDQVDRVRGTWGGPT